MTLSLRGHRVRNISISMEAQNVLSVVNKRQQQGQATQLGDLLEETGLMPDRIIMAARELVRDKQLMTLYRGFWTQITHVKKIAAVYGLFDAVATELAGQRRESGTLLDDLYQQVTDVPLYLTHRGDDFLNHRGGVTTIIANRLRRSRWMP